MIAAIHMFGGKHTAQSQIIYEIEHLEETSMKLEIGDQAPDFELYSDEGHLVKLSDYRGQRVLLFFFPKAKTSG